MSSNATPWQGDLIPVVLVDAQAGTVLQEAKYTLKFAMRVLWLMNGLPSQELPHLKKIKKKKYIYNLPVCLQIITLKISS